MCLTTFDEEKYRTTLLEEGREEGLGKGVDLLFTAVMRLKNGETAEEIIASDIPEAIVEKALLLK